MKCKFCKECKLYNKESRVCNMTAGMYYVDETEPAGCYREMVKKVKEDRKQVLWDIFFIAKGYIGAFILFWLYSSGRLMP